MIQHILFQGLTVVLQKYGIFVKILYLSVFFFLDIYISSYFINILHFIVCLAIILIEKPVKQWFFSLKKHFQSLCLY